MISKQFQQVYDRLVAEATRLGVCPKITMSKKPYLREMRYCGLPLAGQFCAKHRYGV